MSNKQKLAAAAAASVEPVPAAGTAGGAEEGQGPTGGQSRSANASPTSFSDPSLDRGPSPVPAANGGGPKSRTLSAKSLSLSAKSRRGDDVGLANAASIESSSAFVYHGGNTPPSQPLSLPLPAPPLPPAVAPAVPAAPVATAGAYLPEAGQEAAALLQAEPVPALLDADAISGSASGADHRRGALALASVAAAVCGGCDGDASAPSPAPPGDGPAEPLGRGGVHSVSHGSGTGTGGGSCSGSGSGSGSTGGSDNGLLGSVSGSSVSGGGARARQVSITHVNSHHRR